MLVFSFFLCTVVSLTSASLNSERILIRDEEDGLGDITDYSDSRLSPDDQLFPPMADELGSSGDIVSMASVFTDPSSLGFGPADDIDESSDLFESQIAPSDLKAGDLLAFHDGDLPEDGWGSCDFPKMPACCQYTTAGVKCMYYTYFGTFCPDHPADIWPPRTEEEKARNRAVCCDRIVGWEGIGCVPVHDRDEPSMEEEESIGDPPEWPYPALTDFNSIKFLLAPDACRSNYRRDSPIPAQCLPQGQ